MCNHSNNGRAITLPLPANKEEFYKEVYQEHLNKNRVKGLTPGQQELLDTINSSIITLCSGPAGTGKTYIPIIRAIEFLREPGSTFKKIIVARPAVECGDNLGFLPGDLNEKTIPYMRPIMDILNEYFGDPKILQDYIKNETIEFCALAYMRGRTINNGIMILDEAQNAEWSQIVMFMTRIGRDSKIIISGDENQPDRKSLAFKQTLAKNERAPFVDGINVVRLYEEDIVRNGIIREIINKMGIYEEDYNYGNRNR